MQFSQIFIYNIPSTVMYAVAEAVNWVHVIFFIIFTMAYPHCMKTLQMTVSGLNWSYHVS